MSGRPAVSSPASTPRLLVLAGGAARDGRGAPVASAAAEEPRGYIDVFDVVSHVGRLITVRSAFLFEVGEQLVVQLEQDGRRSDATARVRAHLGPDDARVTELELSLAPSPAPAPRSAGRRG